MLRIGSSTYEFWRDAFQFTTIYLELKIAVNKKQEAKYKLSGGGKVLDRTGRVVLTEK